MSRGWILGLLSAALSIACGGSDAAGGDSAGLSAEAIAGVEGIYTLDDLRKNPSACDAPGPSTLASLRDKLFFVASGEVFAQKYVLLASCNSVSDCQSKRTALLNKLPSAPTDEEVDAMLEASRGWLNTAIALAAFAGLRQGEVCGRWKCVMSISGLGSSRSGGRSRRARSFLPSLDTIGSFRSRLGWRSWSVRRSAASCQPRWSL